MQEDKVGPNVPCRIAIKDSMYFLGCSREVASLGWRSNSFDKSWLSGSKPFAGLRAGKQGLRKCMRKV